MPPAHKARLVLQRPCAKALKVAKFLSMDRLAITPELAKELKHWKSKTGWGYNSIYNLLKSRGHKPCKYTLLTKWENLDVKTCRANDYKLYIEAYRTLPSELYNVSKGGRMLGYTPVYEEILEAATTLSNRKISKKILLSMYDAPKDLTEVKLGNIKNGKTRGVKLHHAQWIISTHKRLQSPE